MRSARNSAGLCRSGHLCPSCSKCCRALSAEPAQVLDGADSSQGWLWLCGCTTHFINDAHAAVCRGEGMIQAYNSMQLLELQHRQVIVQLGSLAAPEQAERPYQHFRLQQILACWAVHCLAVLTRARLLLACQSCRPTCCCSIVETYLGHTMGAAWHASDMQHPFSTPVQTLQVPWPRYTPSNAASIHTQQPRHLPDTLSRHCG